jgi:hypothetical protein
VAVNGEKDNTCDTGAVVVVAEVAGDDVVDWRAAIDEVVVGCVPPAPA